MIVNVKKIWMGHASVRDYVVKKVIRLKEDLIIKFNGEVKTYPYRSLRTYLDSKNKTEFKSMFTGEKYYLIDFPWTPTADIT